MYLSRPIELICVDLRVGVLVVELSKHRSIQASDGICMLIALLGLSSLSYKGGWQEGQWMQDLLRGRDHLSASLSDSCKEFNQALFTHDA